ASPAVVPPAVGGHSMPLEGVTVIEMAVMFAAPFGATLLTDLGARVIKIEPLAGDPIRSIMPFPESGGAKVMQGKQSICVDITTPEGLDVVHKLAAKADLVLDGFRSGFAALGVTTSLLLGLLARDRTGEGQRVCSSMLTTATHAMAEQVVDIEGNPPASGPGEDMRGPDALYRVYDAADGWIFLAAPAAA